MRHHVMAAAAVVLGLAALGGRARAGAPAAPDDDLAVVKKAVASPSTRTASASPQAAATPRPAAPEARPAPRPAREPQWFKVRVVDKATGRKKVTINLPLTLVRALGDEPVDWGCPRRAERMDREGCRTIKLSDVLRSLEAGQELVEIEDEEATVRVWVE